MKRDRPLFGRKLVQMCVPLRFSKGITTVFICISIAVTAVKVCFPPSPNTSTKPAPVTSPKNKAWWEINSQFQDGATDQKQPKKQIRTPSPPQTYLFGQNSATELDLFGRLRKAKDELLARDVFLPLSRSHAQKLLPFVHFLLLSLLEVAGIETCAQRTWQWQHSLTPLAPRP